MRKLHSIIIALIILWVSAAEAAPARFGLAPDNSFELFTSTLRSAEKRLLINIYQFESQEIADVIVERIHAGVTVHLLVEGKPFGGRITPEGREVLVKIRNAMAESGRVAHRLWVMSNWHSERERRFVFNHAKYVIVDSSSVLVSSENLSSGGHPLPGRVGNRGWEATVEDAALVIALEKIFKADSSTRYGDVVRIGPKDAIPLPKPREQLKQQGFRTPWSALPFDLSEALGLVDEILPIDLDFEELAPFADSTRAEASERAVPALPIGEGKVDKTTLITSPDSADELVALIKSAKKTIDLEKMNLPSRWRDPEAEGGYKPSPIVEALVAAARRGVKVRALLNDDWAFDPTPDPDAKKKPNDVTVELLSSIARKEKLPIQARIINMKAAGIKYVHNKGILVDGKKVLVSSINGTQNSVVANREVAILLESVDAADYYKVAFDFDWKKSARH